MRPRWASLSGGASFMFLLQYLDLGLVNQWNWQDFGPASHRDSTTIENHQKERSSNVEQEKGHGIWERFR
ncbi:hypothetical protein EAF04_000949 [Stromatinia cepivora]|nr:hypothetical protein EAF04_000949 [Stromatinia cepivora]